MNDEYKSATDHHRAVYEPYVAEEYCYDPEDTLPYHTLRQERGSDRVPATVRPGEKVLVGTASDSWSWVASGQVTQKTGGMLVTTESSIP